MAHPAQPIETCGAAVRETTNLSIAAFAVLKRLQIVKATERRGHGTVDYEFTFLDPDGRWDGLQYEFANSQCAEFDNAVRTLKQLCKRNSRA